MTRRIPIVRSLLAPLDVVASVVAAFPGAILLVDRAGCVSNAWANAASPVSIQGAVGRPVHGLLSLGDHDAVAGQLQLWFACSVGVDSELFQLTLGDPPRHLPAVVGRGALDIDYGPVFDGLGVTTAVVLFVRASAHDAGARPAELDAATPEQIERFFLEMQPLLDDCFAELTKLEADREARQSIHRMFRAMHTIKGAARAAALGAIAEAADAIETRIATLREPGHAVRSEELGALRQCLRQLAQQALVDAPLDAVVDAMASLYGAYRPAMARAEEAFTAWQSRLRDAELAAAFGRAARQLLHIVEPFRMHALAEQIAKLVQLTDSALATHRPERRLLASIDLQLAALHQLVELYQDVYREIRACDNPTLVVRSLAAARGDGVTAVAAYATKVGLVALARRCSDAADAAPVACLLEDLPRLLAPTPPSLGARASLAAAQRRLTDAAAALQAMTADVPDVAPIATSILDAAERLTWMGLDDVSRRVRRDATTLASELGKQVDVQFDAFGIAVPEAVHRVIHEILLHAVRNAIDHGIETVEERRAGGKPASGTLQVSIADTDGILALEVVDDGRGIDLERVRAKAVTHELIEPDAVLSQAQLLDLVFLPGLSTAERVTGVSGRGVGMDAIRALAEDHGGSAQLQSEPGQWTRLSIAIPLRASRNDSRSVLSAAG